MVIGAVNKSTVALIKLLLNRRIAEQEINPIEGLIAMLESLHNSGYTGEQSDQ